MRMTILQPIKDRDRVDDLHIDGVLRVDQMPDGLIQILGEDNEVIAELQPSQWLGIILSRDNG